MVEIDYTWGAAPSGDGQWRFRLWAPGAARMSLRLNGVDHKMEGSSDGWFALVRPAAEGDAYGFVLPDGLVVPDPAARRQQEGVHGLSLVTAPRRANFWAGRPWEEAVIYELHVGTFTEAGSYRAATSELDRLADLGITAIELLPLAQFGGARGWGYDGVLPYAPHPVYGTPDDLAAFVTAAHERGLMLLLDVVYNHFGPDGNYLHAYAPAFFDEGRNTPWGAGIDYREPPVRRFFIENAFYWLAEYGFDGLRLDAIDQIEDPSDPELLVELARELRARLDRPVHLTTEDNRNVTYLHERGQDGEIVLHSGEWNDDFHNAAHVLATGESEGYYRDYADDPLGLLGRSLAEGFAFQGETGRGAPSAHLPPTAFVDFLQNHDQTGNRARGDRLATLTDPETLEVLTAILLLSPHIPMLFMGEEYGETRPFCFFAGFEGDLGEAVRKGRREEFKGFAGFHDVPDPIAAQTMSMSTLDPAQRDSPSGHDFQSRVKRLLDLRHAEIVPRLAGTCGDSGRLLVAADGALAVDWQLDGGLLQLRANFADHPRELPAVDGRELHKVREIGAPKSAVHWLQVAA